MAANQIDLNEFVRTHVRKTCPDTSEAAAIAVARPASGDHIRLVIEALERSDAPLTAEQLADRIPQLDRYQVMKRLSDLRNWGQIVDSGRRLKNASGRSAVAWLLRSREG